MKIDSYKKFGALTVCVALLLSTVFAAFTSVSANNPTPKATFTYGNYTGVETAVGVNPDDIEIIGDSLTLPENENVMNLYWRNGENTYEAGADVNITDLVKDANGNYPFTAFFGAVSLDFDEFDTEPFTFYTQGETNVSNDGFFSQFQKNQWWKIPAGYAAYTNGTSTYTAFGADTYSVKKNSEKGGNSLYLSKWAGSGDSNRLYKNAAFFTHTPFDTTDPNSHNSNATGKVNYSYVYFTPGQVYTVTFDYKIDKTGGNGNPPFNASIAFGMGTQNGDDAKYKTVQYGDASTLRAGIELKENSTSWEQATITLAAPNSYTGNGITSARMGISLDVHTGGGMVIDNIQIKPSGTKVNFKYDTVNGSKEALGEDFVAYADDDGNITMPSSAMNVLWNCNGKVYKAGETVNIKSLGDNVTFTASFGGIIQDFENISVDKFDLANGDQKGKTLYEELSRNPSYWKIPKGWANAKSSSSDVYGTTLGCDRLGINTGWGKESNGLRYQIDSNYSSVGYKNAALFSHSPTTFGTSDTLTYSYVYYTPGEEYTMEFDYNTTASVDVAIAYGIDGSYYDYTKSATESVNSADYGKSGNHITLASTNGEWKHASLTVKAPDSYTGNGVTSARVGIAIKDSTVYGGSKRYDYFDNIAFYPADSKMVSFSYGAGDGIVGASNTVEFIYGNQDITLPKNESAENLYWKHGNDLYKPGDKVNTKDLGNDLTFTAYYGAVYQDFSNINTNNVTLPTTAGNQSKNLYEELSRNPSYWRVPKGLSNVQSGSNYGLALGHDRMGVISGKGKIGKGLQLLTDKTYTAVAYRNAALFNHTPTSFGANDNITYSYVYYNLGEEYTLEFDYKAADSIDVAVAFGIDTAVYNEHCGTQSVSMSDFDANHITLEATDNEWKHAKITVKAPNTYSANGVTSARVGIAVKDSEVYDGSNKRYDYFDNISFYPSTMTCHTAKINRGSETDDSDTSIVNYFKFKSPLNGDTSVLLPGKDSIYACLRTGTNKEGVFWTQNYGTVSNLIGWKLNGTDKVYAPDDKASSKDLPDNAVFSAVYGDASNDFENIDESFTIYNKSKLSYGSSKAVVKTEDDNTFVRFVSEEGMTDREQNHIIVFTDKSQFAGYNPGSTYKVTFKYRRTDNSNKDVSIRFSFGAVPYDWLGNNRKIKSSEVCATKKNMSDFETVTAVVEAPDKQIFVNSAENYYTSCMAIAVELSEGVTIDIDDINIEVADLIGDSFGKATFDYGDSDKAGDTLTMQFAEALMLPGKQTPYACVRKGVNGEGKAWTANYGKVGNQNAWYCTTNKKYYELGDKVSMDELGKNPKFIAVYEKASTNFDNLSSDFEFNVSNTTSYGSDLTKVQGTETNKYINITGGEQQKNTSIQFMLIDNDNNFMSYNAGKTYKVTFKYRRNDKTDAVSSLFVGFGAVNYGWRASSNAVSKVEIATTKTGMKNFETVTAYVTAPDDYEYSSGGTNPEYFYARTLSVGAKVSNGVSIDFDDVNIQAIGRDEVAMTFCVEKQNLQKVVIGKKGQKLTIPKLDIDRNTVISGWYLDSKFTKSFNMTKYPETGIKVYGETTDAQVRYYGFTDYPWDAEIDDEGKRAREEHHIIEKGMSSDGDGYALKIDNTSEDADIEQQGVCIPIRIKPNTKYLISYDFYMEKIGDATAPFTNTWFNTTVWGKTWKGHKEHVTSTDEYIPASVEEGKWYTGYVYGTTTEFTWSNTLTIFNRVPVGGIKYVDNIIITEIPEGYSVAMFKLASFQSPKPIVAKTNSTITMPAGKVPSDFAFINWVLENEDYTDKTYKLEKDTEFTARTTVRVFGENFEKTDYGERGLNTFGLDLDWEIYDSSKGTASNVKSGRYSLHKIGKDLRNSAYCIHHNAEITKYLMAVGKTYTVTFYTKVENPVHKLGAINIASCLSLANPWDFSSDEYNVVPIADIADGEWHKVTYSFTASGEYLSFIVPGNLSIYLDDISLEYTPDAKLSGNCEFEEYVPAFLTDDGEYIKPVVESNTRGKFELVKRTVETAEESSGNSTLWIICIAGGIILLGGVALLTVLLIRKKKKGGK